MVEDKVALDIYYKEDILNALRGLHVASEGPASLAVDLLGDPDLRASIESGDVPLEKLLQIYRRGFHTALAAVGLSFGLVPLERGQGGQGDRLRSPSQSTPAPCDRRPGSTEARLDDGAGLDSMDLIGFLGTVARWEEQQR
jgi:hypothetical protein